MQISIPLNLRRQAFTSADDIRGYGEVKKLETINYCTF